VSFVEIPEKGGGRIQKGTVEKGSRFYGKSHFSFAGEVGKESTIMCSAKKRGEKPRDRGYGLLLNRKKKKGTSQGGGRPILIPLLSKQARKEGRD